MQLYADENFPLPVVEELRRLGHDVLTAQEDGGQSTPDPTSSPALIRWDAPYSRTTGAISSAYTGKGRRIAASCRQHGTTTFLPWPAVSTMPWSGALRAAG